MHTQAGLIASGLVVCLPFACIERDGFDLWGPKRDLSTESISLCYRARAIAAPAQFGGELNLRPKAPFGCPHAGGVLEMPNTDGGKLRFRSTLDFSPAPCYRI